MSQRGEAEIRRDLLALAMSNIGFLRECWKSETAALEGMADAEAVIKRRECEMRLGAIEGKNEHERAAALWLMLDGDLIATAARDQVRDQQRLLAQARCEREGARFRLRLAIASLNHPFEAGESILSVDSE